jgi:hypothetical protein
MKFESTFRTSRPPDLDPTITLVDWRTKLNLMFDIMDTARGRGRLLDCDLDDKLFLAFNDFLSHSL